MSEFTSTNPQISYVKTFCELHHFSFVKNRNAVCWERNLEGNFKEIIAKLQLKEDITEISVEDLLKLNLTTDGDLARQHLISDFKLLNEIGAAPQLNLIKSYHRDVDFHLFPTDVYSFHADSSPVPTSTFLCTYFGASSEILPNKYAMKKVNLPEILEELKTQFKDENALQEYITEHFLDLHYQPLPGAEIINLRKFDMCKIATAAPNCDILPCIHRAPQENSGELRLMLIC